MQRTSAPLTVEALAVLVNERLAREGSLGRVSIEDVRGAVAYGTHPLVDTMALDGDRVTVESRSSEKALNRRRCLAAIKKTQRTLADYADAVGRHAHGRGESRPATPSIAFARFLSAEAINE